MTLLQETVEPERQGRVFGFVGIVMALAMPIGMVVFGPLADVVPIEWLLVAAGVLTFVVARRRRLAARRPACGRGGARRHPVCPTRPPARPRSRP